MSYILSPFGMGNFDAISGDSPDEHRVREIIGEVLSEEKELGSFDDTKVYNTYDAMVSAEPVGREDTLYVITTDDIDHGTRYVWDGSQYVSLQDTITSDEIRNIVN